MKLSLYLSLFCVFAILLTSAIDANEEAKNEDDEEDNAGEQSFNDGFSEEEHQKMEKTAEKHEFQAEVSRLMDIIINSLYTHKEIFLREVISNASDALDKIRYISLTNKEALETKHELDIVVTFDKENKMLHITDSGIGMTKADLISHLGTIAKSGTSSFLEKIQSGGDMALIGQFGVGFYSVYLVADKVTVTTKHNDDKQLIWQSSADSAYTIYEDPRGNTLGRGTRLTLHLKEDAEEFLDAERIKSLVGKYSEFINYPIKVKECKMEDVEVPDEDAIKKAEEEKAKKAEENKDKEDVDIKDADESKDEKKLTKKVKEETCKETVVNENKALWTRNPSDVKKEEYNAFYKAMSKDNDDPMGHLHFTAEGEIEFRAVMFTPKKAPLGTWDNSSKMSNIKLYVRRVFITDTFDDLMPRYLAFVRGVVDSEDLPLNVSREMLQTSKVLRVIKKKLVNKAIEMVREIASKPRKSEEKKDDEKKDDEKKDDEKKDDEKKDDEKKDKKDDEEDSEDSNKKTDKNADPSKEPEDHDDYIAFWKEYGKAIKLGVYEDSSNRTKLAKLLRFKSTKSGSNMTSLDGYVNRMKPSQKNIYYISGESESAVENSPYLEQLKKRDFEVLYFTEAIDEYSMPQLTEFKSHQFMSVNKEGLKFGDDDEKSSEDRLRKQKDKFKKLTDWMKDTLSGKIDKVTLSNRVVDSPAVIVSSQYGWSANMERIMKAQALQDSDRAGHVKASKTLELNARHPVVRKLFDVLDEKPELAKDIAWVIHDTALLHSGLVPEEPAVFGARLERMTRAGLGISADTPLADEAADDDHVTEEEKRDAERKEKEAKEAAEKEAKAAEEKDSNESDKSTSDATSDETKDEDDEKEL